MVEVSLISSFDATDDPPTGVTRVKILMIVSIKQNLWLNSNWNCEIQKHSEGLGTMMTAGIEHSENKYTLTGMERN